MVDFDVPITKRGGELNQVQEILMKHLPSAEPFSVLFNSPILEDLRTFQILSL